MILPRQDPDGLYYISYSQLKLWTEIKAFNTGLSGKKEFIRSYFLGEQYPDKGGYGTFGTEVEAYITERREADKFTEAERSVLEGIEPLGVYQHEGKLPFDGFYLKLFIDDCTPDYRHIRDYKTCSEKSGEKYKSDEYFQLDVYALYIKHLTGQLPEKMGVCCIERLGNGFKGGRSALSVGNKVWYIKRETNDERLAKLEQFIINTTKEISEYYEVFLELNK